MEIKKDSLMDHILSATFEGLNDYDGIARQVGFIWQHVKFTLIVPVLKVLVVLCLVMSIMLFVERVYMGVVIVLVKLFRYKPQKHYVYQLSIGAACELSWPSDRIIVQVLDDSTDPVIKV
ncbi:unnamed protein product [Lupinus luteus]|uniref:Uncharacterized protein n=1 Tax=Lupinus luteus TaxID=3873 RepID=A0AAV1XI25_LUPLU